MTAGQKLGWIGMMDQSSFPGSLILPPLGCDPALSVLVMLMSRNVFPVVSALQSIAFIYIYFLCVFGVALTPYARDRVGP